MMGANLRSPPDSYSREGSDSHRSPSRSWRPNPEIFIPRDGMTTSSQPLRVLLLNGLNERTSTCKSSERACAIVLMSVCIEKDFGPGGSETLPGLLLSPLTFLLFCFL